MNYKALLKRLIYPEINLLMGVDIDNNSIKISEVKYRKGIKPFFKNFAIERIPNGLIDNGYIINEAGFVDFFKEALARNQFSTKYAVVSINSRDTVLRQIELPLMSYAEAQEALRWDLEKYVPSAANEEHYYDMHVLNEIPENKQMRILVMRDSGLKLLAVDSEVLALGRAVPAAGNRVIIDVDRTYTKIIIFEDGVPMISRLIALGWDRYEDVLQRINRMSSVDATATHDEQQNADELIELSEIERTRLAAFVDELGRDVLRTVTYFQSTSPAAQVDSFLLIGENMNTDKLMKSFEEKLSMKADAVNLFDSFSINHTFKRDYLAQYETQLMISVGLALWGEGEVV